MINVKNKVNKNGYRRRSCTSKTAKIHRFVRFVVYYFITTVPVAFYCACSDEIVHYKSDETLNFCYCIAVIYCLFTVKPVRLSWVN